MRIVSDSGHILAFARAHRLDLLHEVVRELVIPDAVYEEVVIQEAGKPGSHEVAQASWIMREQVRDHTFGAQLS